MSTRAGARDKIAKVIECVHSGGIVEQDPSQSEDDDTSMTKKVNKMEATKPSSWKKTRSTKAANTAKKPKTTKRADVTAATEADVVVKKSLAAKLAQLEDKFLKEADISSLLHPCQYSVKVQGNATPS